MSLSRSAFAAAEGVRALRDVGLFREVRSIDSPQGSRVRLDDRQVLLFGSNNYLGLADNPMIRRAATEAIQRWGVGAGASPLVSGAMSAHVQLERELAAFEGYGGALLFSSGYVANLGAVTSLARLAGTDAVIYSDKLNHASTVDACRLAQADVFVYDHCDVEHLRWGLNQNHGRPAVIATESIFSMDGDVAPLTEIVHVARDYGAYTIIDEAHATGTFGPEGRGVVGTEGLEHEVDVVVGTLGKAFGTVGAFICCSCELRSYLINTARPFIFSTAPSPALVGAATAALRMLSNRPEMVLRLQSNATLMRHELAERGADVARDGTHIIPLIVGDSEAAVEVSRRALEAGVFAQAIRPPTVPVGTARLRLSVMATHTQGEIKQAAKKLMDAMRGGASGRALASSTTASVA